jgi:hypothetical protein
MPPLADSFARCMALDRKPEKTVECNIIRKARNEGFSPES